MERKHWIEYAASFGTCVAALGAAIAAAFAGYQASISRDSEERQLRAYVDDTATVLIGIENSEVLRLQSSFRNFGQTPAEKFTYSWGSILGPLPSRDIFETGLTPFKAEGTQTIFPQSESKWRDTISIQGGLGEITEKGKVVSFFGKISYDDAFGHQRTTLFCFFFDRSDVENLQRTNSGTYGQKCNNDNSIK